MDAPIKSVTTNPGITSQISLCSVNSINVGRIVAQTIHYFWVYLRVRFFNFRIYFFARRD